MNGRSNRAEVRNPVLALPALRALLSLDPQVRGLLAGLLRDLQQDARARAERCWASHKPPLAAYWAAVGVYAGHIARVIRPTEWRHARPVAMIVSQQGYPDLPADGWADASRLYVLRRERSGLGAGGFSEATVVVDGITVARISCNGRIWPPEPRPGPAQPLYNNQRLAA